MSTTETTFQHYLDKSGFVDSLVKALITLHDDTSKPDNVNQYIANLLSQDSQQLKARIAQLEQLLQSHQIPIPDA